MKPIGTWNGIKDKAKKIKTSIGSWNTINQKTRRFQDSDDITEYINSKEFDKDLKESIKKGEGEKMLCSSVKTILDRLQSKFGSDSDIVINYKRNVLNEMERIYGSNSSYYKSVDQLLNK